jgi:hypothetical protein
MTATDQAWECDVMKIAPIPRSESNPNELTGENRHEYDPGPGPEALGPNFDNFPYVNSMWYKHRVQLGGDCVYVYRAQETVWI